MLKPALVLLAVFAATGASAQGAKSPDQCTALNVALDDRIAGCTAIIDAKKETGRALSIAYCNRGRVFALKGDVEKAMADYDRAIRLDPKFAIAYNNRGDALMTRGDIDKAIADFSTAIKHDPQNVHAYGNRGWAHQRKRDFARALADYGSAIELAPNDLLGYINRGNVYRHGQPRACRRARDYPSRDRRCRG